MADPSLLAPLALVHPYRNKQPNHTAMPPSSSASSGEGGNGHNTAETGAGAGTGAGVAFSVPDV